MKRNGNIEGWLHSARRRSEGALELHPRALEEPRVPVDEKAFESAFDLTVAEIKGRLQVIQDLPANGLGEVCRQHQLRSLREDEENEPPRREDRKEGHKENKLNHEGHEEHEEGHEVTQEGGKWWNLLRTEGRKTEFMLGSLWRLCGSICFLPSCLRG